MINNNGGQHTVLDWITRITPNMAPVIGSLGSLRPRRYGMPGGRGPAAG